MSSSRSQAFGVPSFATCCGVSFVPGSKFEAITSRGRAIVTRKVNRLVLPRMSVTKKSSDKGYDEDRAYVNTSWDGGNIDCEILLSKVKFDGNGLVPAIAQQYDSNEVLMMAWMSAESIKETMRQGRAVYFSRSRKSLWRKGDTSGQVQYIRDVQLDCDADTILLKVDQVGVACHTGRRSCFYFAYRPPFGEPQIIADVITDPGQLYGTDPKTK